MSSCKHYGNFNGQISPYLRAGRATLIGHPPARVTSQDGQYTLHVYVKKGGVISDKFPAGRPEANSPIYYRFKNISLRVPFWRLTAQYTIDLGPFSLWSSLRVRFWRAYRTSRGRFLVIFVSD